MKPLLLIPTLLLLGFFATPPTRAHQPAPPPIIPSPVNVEPVLPAKEAPAVAAAVPKPPVKGGIMLNFQGASLTKVIATLDKPKPQVLIKVVFLEVTYNKDSDIGVEGSSTFNLKNGKLATTGSRVSTSTTGSTTNGTTTTVTTPLDTAAGVGTTLGLANSLGLAALTEGSFIRLASDDWFATLHALRKRENSRCCRGPRSWRGIIKRR
jgi:hypothetical protein